MRDHDSPTLRRTSDGGLSSLLPTIVSVSQFVGPGVPPWDLELRPNEAAAVSRARPGRLREFAVARACARRALARLRAPSAGIGRGPAGEPQWPSGVVGSITHCAGYVGAAVAWRRDVLTLGVDAEPHLALPDGVLELVASTTEIAHLDALSAADPGVHWGRLLFCAKESLYKAWYPVERRWLGFDDVDVRLDPAGRFRCRLLASAPPSRPFGECRGRWLVDDGVLLAALMLPATRPAP